MTTWVERAKSSLVGTKLGRLAQARSHARFKAKLARDLNLVLVANEVYDVDECVRRLVHQADMNCVDVGAHLGTVTAEFLHLAPGGGHIAFEPTPRKAGWLARKFPRVKVYQKAVAEFAGRATFYDNVGNSGFSGLRAPGAFSREVQEVEVEVVRLDDALDGVEVGFMKIDVEGAELSALRGARKTLARCRPPVLFECTRTGLDNFDVDGADVYNELVGNSGYEIFIPRDFLAANAPLSCDGFLTAMQYPFNAFNFIALPNAA